MGAGKYSRAVKKSIERHVAKQRQFGALVGQKSLFEFY